MKETFVFRKEWVDAIKDFKEEVRLEIYEAIIEYGLTSKISRELGPLTKMAFGFVKNALDKDAEKYKITSEKRREAAKHRWECKPMQKTTRESKSMQLHTLASFAMQSATKDYNNEYDNEYDTLKSESKCASATTHEEVVKTNDKHLKKFFKNSSAQMESLLMGLGMKPDDASVLESLAQEIVNEWNIAEQLHTDYNDFSRHLMSTIKIRVQRSKEAGMVVSKSEEQKRVAIMRDEESDERNRRYEEMRRNAVSYAEARKSPEYLRALNEAR